MTPKWPLNLPVTADAIRTKVRDLRQRRGEWTQFELHALRRIEAEADEVVRILDLACAGPVDERAAVLAAARRFADGLKPTMFELRGGAQFDVHDWIVDALRHGADMLGDIVLGIRRSDTPDASTFAVDADSLADAAADAIIAGLDEKRMALLTSAAAAEWALADMDDGFDPQTNASPADIRNAENRRETRRRAYELRAANGNERALKRIGTVFAAAVAHYHLPERLHPQPNADDDTWHWSVGRALPGEPSLVPGDPRRTLRPNGNIQAPPILDSIGDIHPRTVCSIAAEVERILLIAGRDAEIALDFKVHPSAPPPWCVAAALPIALLMRSDERGGSGFHWSEAAGGIVDVDEHQLDDDGIAAISSHPLLDGTRLTYYGQLPLTVRQALHDGVGMPIRRIVDHPCLADDRITIRSTVLHDDDSMTFLLDCPTVRVGLLPEGHEGREDPIAAWSEYGRRLDVLPFYTDMDAIQRRAHERLAQQRDEERLRLAASSRDDAEDESDAFIRRLNERLHEETGRADTIKEREDFWYLYATHHGWSPTLHDWQREITIALLQNARALAKTDTELQALRAGIEDGDLETYVRLVMVSIDEARREDAERSAAAAALGIEAPLDPSEVDHVMVDRFTAMLINGFGDDAAESMPGIVQFLHETSTGSESPALVTMDGQRGENFPAELRLLESGGTKVPMVTMALPIAPDRKHGSFDGIGLDIPDPAFPETVMNAIVGRRLGDIIQTGTPLDDRTILSVEHPPLKKLVGPRLRLALEIDPVPIARSGLQDVGAAPGWGPVKRSSEDDEAES